MKSLGVQKHILLQRCKYKCDKHDKSPIMKYWKLTESLSDESSCRAMCGKLECGMTECI
jgi:hypothetical protein